MSTPAYRWLDVSWRLQSVDAFRPLYGSGIVTATTGKTTVEVVLPIDFAQARCEQGCALVRLVCTKAPCYFAFGSLGSAAKFNDTNMAYLPVETAMVCRLDATDLSFYHRQMGSSGTIQAVLLK